MSALAPPQYWPGAYGLAAPSTIAEMKDGLRAVARHLVSDVVAEWPALATVPTELHEIEGRPADVLVEQSRTGDLLVVGHRVVAVSPAQCSDPWACTA